MQAQHEQIALVSLHAFYNRLHFVALNKLGRQVYALPFSGLLCTGPAGPGSNRRPADAIE